MACSAASASWRGWGCEASPGRAGHQDRRGKKRGWDATCLLGQLDNKGAGPTTASALLGGLLPGFLFQINSRQAHMKRWLLCGFACRALPISDLWRGSTIRATKECREQGRGYPSQRKWGDGPAWSSGACSTDCLASVCTNEWVGECVW